MQKKLINSQLSNWKTYEMYKRQMLTLAENVFEFENLPEFIDTAYLNKDKIYNEVLRLICIANLSFQKKERNIKDEVQAMQGGTIASRYSRFEPRKKAVDMINKKFDIDMKVKYYDGIPNSMKNFEDEQEEMEVDNDVS